MQKCICVFLSIVPLAGTYGTCLHTGGHRLRSSSSGQSHGEHVPLFFIYMSPPRTFRRVICHGTPLNGRRFVKTGTFYITADHFPKNIIVI